jgi:hypothetical protein
MRRLPSLIAVLALLSLSFAACGDDDDETTTAGATGTTGAQDGSSGSDLTAEEFIAASIPDEVEAVQELVAADPACEGVDAQAGGDFQVAVAIDAASAPPDTPLSEVVSGQCEEN